MSLVTLSHIHHSGNSTIVYRYAVHTSINAGFSVTGIASVLVSSFKAFSSAERCCTLPTGANMDHSIFIQPFITAGLKGLQWSMWECVLQMHVCRRLFAVQHCGMCDLTLMWNQNKIFILNELWRNCGLKGIFASLSCSIFVLFILFNHSLELVFWFSNAHWP